MVKQHILTTNYKDMNIFVAIFKDDFISSANLRFL